MQFIEVDNDVFAYLQKHAQPFIDTPSSTLRRLLGIDSINPQIATTHKEFVEDSDSQIKQKLTEFSDANGISGKFKESLTESSRIAWRLKKPKTDLSKLIQANFLRDGQKLYLVDYQGNRVRQFSATLSVNSLIYNNRKYSMSNLAQKLLTEVGFQSSSVCGTARWVTEEGKAIQDLWKRYLEVNQSNRDL
ncbi:MAG: hypothetical protein J0H48_11075 [Nitrosospira multiformis]|nr:hypothetical protein [Nitrosospira multiformis]